MDQFKLTLPNKREYVISARLAATSIASVFGFDIEKIRTSALLRQAAIIAH